MDAQIANHAGASRTVDETSSRAVDDSFSSYTVSGTLFIAAGFVVFVSLVALFVQRRRGNLVPATGPEVAPITPVRCHDPVPIVSSGT